MYIVHRTVYIIYMTKNTKTNEQIDDEFIKELTSIRTYEKILDVVYEEYGFLEMDEEPDEDDVADADAEALTRLFDEGHVIKAVFDKFLADNPDLTDDQVKFLGEQYIDPDGIIFR